jgi:hypothetical protein
MVNKPHTKKVQVQVLCYLLEGTKLEKNKTKQNDETYHEQKKTKKKRTYIKNRSVKKMCEHSNNKGASSRAKSAKLDLCASLSNRRSGDWNRWQACRENGR